MLQILSSRVKQGNVIGLTYCISSVWKWIKNLLTSSKDLWVHKIMVQVHRNWTFFFFNNSSPCLYFSSLPSPIFPSLHQDPRSFAFQRPKDITRHPQQLTENFSHNSSPILSYLSGKNKEKGGGETEVWQSWIQLTNQTSRGNIFLSLFFKGTALETRWLPDTGLPSSSYWASSWARDRVGAIGLGSKEDGVERRVR